MSLGAAFYLYTEPTLGGLFRCLVASPCPELSNKQTFTGAFATSALILLRISCYMVLL